MKKFIFLFLFLLNATPLLAADCKCVGLASNFPGFSLICDKVIIERFPFNSLASRSVELSKNVCEYNLNHYIGAPTEAKYESCACRESTGQIELIGQTQSVNETVSVFGFGRDKSYAVIGCNTLLEDFKNAGICLK